MPLSGFFSAWSPFSQKLPYEHIITERFTKNPTSEHTMDGSTIIGAHFSVRPKDPTIGPQIMDIFLEGKIQPGPSVANIIMHGIETVEPKNGNDFRIKPEEINKFDAQSTFAYVYRVLHFYDRILQQINPNARLDWQWNLPGEDGKPVTNKQPIVVSPHADVDTNAYYTREGQCLNFGWVIDEKNGVKHDVCTAEGVVAHESGHAALDALCPGFLSSYLPQTGAIHEAFGDITSIFILLNDLQTCKKVVNDSEGDLKKPGLFLPDLANQFGESIGLHGGLRNANNNIKLKDAGTEVHALSQVFTGAIYDILSLQYTANYKKDTSHDSAEILKKTSNDLVVLLIKSLLSSPKSNAGFADVANNMIKFSENNQELQNTISKSFSDRGVDLKAAPKAISSDEILNADYSKCSGTLKQPSVVHSRQQHLSIRISEDKAKQQAEEKYAKQFTRLGF
jgi:hypothetical protein